MPRLWKEEIDAVPLDPVRGRRRAARLAGMRGVLGHLGSLDRVFGVPVTTRGWNTMTAIAAILT